MHFEPNDRGGSPKLPQTEDVPDFDYASFAGMLGFIGLRIAEAAGASARAVCLSESGQTIMSCYRARPSGVLGLGIRSPPLRLPSTRNAPRVKARPEFPHCSGAGLSLRVARNVCIWRRTAGMTGSERIAVAIRDDVLRVTRGRPTLWVQVDDVAHRLGLDHAVAAAAVQWAIDSGWFVGDGEPPHSVRLRVSSLQQLS